MIPLLPRLPGPAADRLLDHMLTQDGLRWSGFVADALPGGVRYAATGGTTVTPARLRELRTGLVGLASGFGYGTDAAKNDAAGFDAALGGWLADLAELGTGEALRDDVWTFLGVSLAPDIVHWRFGASRERYLGGVRNTFQRSWLRAKALDRGNGQPDRWALLELLSEDALVQIIERPAIGADPILARELAEGWVRASGRVGRGRMEAIMRLATLRLRIRNEIQALSLLPRDEIARTIDEFFDKAGAALEAPASKVQNGSGSDTPGSPGHPMRQAKTSSAVEDETASPGSATTRKRSWAIWRAR